METLPDWNELQRAIGAVPRGTSGYTTNFYSPPDQVARWCTATPLRALHADGAVLVLRADRDFHHVYHAAESLPALTAALALLPVGSYATDLIGRVDALDRVCDAYAAAGFGRHAFLARMNRVQPPAGRDTAQPADEADGAEPATPTDVPAVAAFLDRLLDPFVEQLPDEDEMRNAATAGRLLLVRGPRGIAGMLQYDIKGQMAHLRFWHVDHDARGEGVGRRLMAAFLARCTHVRRIVLWVIGDNERSIAIYHHYGFVADELLDRIMILHKDPHR